MATYRNGVRNLINEKWNQFNAQGPAVPGVSNPYNSPAVQTPPPAPNKPAALPTPTGGPNLPATRGNTMPAPTGRQPVTIDGQATRIDGAPPRNPNFTAGYNPGQAPKPKGPSTLRMTAGKMLGPIAAGATAYDIQEGVRGDLNYPGAKEYQGGLSEVIKNNAADSTLGWIPGVGEVVSDSAKRTVNAINRAPGDVARNLRNAQENPLYGTGEGQTDLGNELFNEGGNFLQRAGTFIESPIKTMQENFFTDRDPNAFGIQETEQDILDRQEATGYIPPEQIPQQDPNQINYNYDAGRNTTTASIRDAQGGLGEITYGGKPVSRGGTVNYVGSEFFNTPSSKTGQALHEARMAAVARGERLPGEGGGQAPSIDDQLSSLRKQLAATRSGMTAGRSLAEVRANTARRRDLKSQISDLMGLKEAEISGNSATQKAQIAQLNKDRDFAYKMGQAQQKSSDAEIKATRAMFERMYPDDPAAANAAMARHMQNAADAQGAGEAAQLTPEGRESLRQSQVRALTEAQDEYGLGDRIASWFGGGKQVSDYDIANAPGDLTGYKTGGEDWMGALLPDWMYKGEYIEDPQGRKIYRDDFADEYGEAALGDLERAIQFANPENYKR